MERANEVVRLEGALAAAQAVPGAHASGISSRPAAAPSAPSR